jgi:hypothetical protein
VEAGTWAEEADRSELTQVDQARPETIGARTSSASVAWKARGQVSNRMVVVLGKGATWTGTASIEVATTERRDSDPRDVLDSTYAPLMPMELSRNPGNTTAGPLPGTKSGDLAVASFAMARRLEAGATVWCLSPDSPQHADDVVADLTRPTAEGRRALRAVAVHDPDPVGRLREQADSGDLLLAISAVNQVEVAATMRRAPAWGLATIWIGSGPRPEPGAADNVLWVDQGSDSDLESHADDLAALRHRLLELTRAWLEEPSLFGRDDPGACSVDGVCVTCSDEGHLGEVVTVRVEGDFDRLAVARTASGLEEIDASLVGDLAPGDLVVIHAGSAIGLVEDGSESASETAHYVAGGTAGKTGSGSAR